MMRRGGNWGVVAVAAVLALAGCSGGEPGAVRAGTSAGSDASTGAGSDTEPAEQGETQQNTPEAAAYVQDLKDRAERLPWPLRTETEDAALTAVAVDAESSVSAKLGPAGGDVILADGGVTYTLHLPQDALLFETEITLAPIRSIAGLPEIPLSGVDMQPHGLQLAAMAELEITGLPAGEPVLGFAYSGIGFDLRPAPIAPDPERLVVYVSHFSGAGVGPFAALGEALEAAGPTAAAATGTAAVHNRAPGSTRDQLGETFFELIQQLNEFNDVARRECANGIPANNEVLDWIALDADLNGEREQPVSLKTTIRQYVELLVSCWDDAAASECLSPSPKMVRELQGIKALLTRWRALQTEEERAAQPVNTGRWATPFCSGGGTLDYSYADGGSQISAEIAVKLQKSEDGWEVLPDASFYDVAQVDVGSDPTCPSTLWGRGSFSFGDDPSGDVPPSLEFDQVDDDTYALWVAPVYPYHSTDCYGSDDGYVMDLILGCNPDGSGSDSLVGTLDHEATVTTVSFACNDPSMNAKVEGSLLLQDGVADIIPTDLWQG